MEQQSEIQVWKTTKPGPVLATVSAVIPTAWGDIVLDRLRVIRKEDQAPWLALPQASYVKDGETRYQNIIQLPLRLKRHVEARVFEELGITGAK